MRLSIKFLTLLSATTVLGGFLENFSDVLGNIDSKIQECKAALDEYKECKVDTVHLDRIADNIDEFCTSFATEKCQNLYKEGYSLIPACLNIPKEYLGPGQILSDVMYTLLTLSCSKDENGDFCPLAGKNVLTKDGMTEEQFMELLEETCDSKQCYDAVSDTFTMAENADLLTKLLFKKTTNVGSQSPSIEKVNNFLQSESCTTKVAESSSEPNVSNKLNSILFIGLSLAFTLFL